MVWQPARAGMTRIFVDFERETLLAKRGLGPELISANTRSKTRRGGWVNTFSLNSPNFAESRLCTTLSPRTHVLMQSLFLSESHLRNDLRAESERGGGGEDLFFDNARLKGSIFRWYLWRGINSPTKLPISRGRKFRFSRTQFCRAWHVGLPSIHTSIENMCVCETGATLLPFRTKGNLEGDEEEEESFS